MTCHIPAPPSSNGVLHPGITRLLRGRGGYADPCRRLDTNSTGEGRDGMRIRLGRIASATFVAAGLLAGSDSSAAGQLGVSVGSSVYSDDHEFCIMSGAAITHYQAD